MQIGRQAAAGAVPREDFDAALSRIQALSEQIAVLEARLDSLAQTRAKTKTKPARGCQISEKDKKACRGQTSLGMLGFLAKTTIACGIDTQKSYILC